MKRDHDHFIGSCSTAIETTLISVSMWITLILQSLNISTTIQHAMKRYECSMKSTANYHQMQNTEQFISIYNADESREITLQYDATNTYLNNNCLRIIQRQTDYYYNRIWCIICNYISYVIGIITHWDQDTIANILQMTYPNVFWWNKLLLFELNFVEFLGVQLTLSQHWFRYLPSVKQGTSHCLLWS